MSVTGVLQLPAPAVPDLLAYFFTESRFVLYNVLADMAARGYPQSISGKWKGVWSDGIDAAVNWGNGKAYFFKGANYIRYDLAADRADEGYPKPIAGNWPGIGWADGIDAAANWGDGKAYFFKGAHYIRYDLARDRADEGYPKPIAADWPGVWTDGLSAAVNWGNGKAYFFKGDQYIRYDLTARRADDGYPLPIAEYWPGLLPIHTHTSFDVAKDGFHFVNSFTIDPRMFGSTGSKWTMGLCGGMSAAALDYHRKGIPIPALTHPPKQQCPELDLFWQLFGYQMYSLYPVTLFKVLAWQALPDRDTTIPSVPDTHLPPTQITGVSTLTLKEWTRLRAELDQGRSQVICLVRSSGSEDPSENHQVLAIGYRLENPYEAHIQIYDPNHPDEEQELSLQLLSEDGLIHGTESDGKAFRGFFLND